jgi:dsRNA-specific ribonuclease
MLSDSETSCSLKELKEFVKEKLLSPELSFLLDEKTEKLYSSIINDESSIGIKNIVKELFFIAPPSFDNDSDFSQSANILFEKWYISNKINSQIVKIIKNIETPEEQKSMMTIKFKDFITSLLQKCGLKDKAISDVLTYQDKNKKTGLEYFQHAFTHKSSSTDGLNYELYELLGDTIMNCMIMQYIHERFPRIVNVKWLTRIKHTLISKTICGNIAGKLGFFQHIKYGEDMEEKLKVRDETNDIYMSFLEDTLESFLGCLMNITSRIYKYKIGYQFAYNFVSNILDEIRIPIEYSQIFDSKSRLKEIYDKRGWKLNNQIETQTINNSTESEQVCDTHVVKVYGYPLGDKKASIQNRCMLACAEGKSIKIAQQIACEQAIKKLKLHNIFEIQPNPYEQNLNSKRIRREQLKNHKNDTLVSP